MCHHYHLFSLSEQLLRVFRPVPYLCLSRLSSRQAAQNMMLAHNTRATQRLGNMLTPVIHCIPPRFPSAPWLHQNALILRCLTKMPFFPTHAALTNMFSLLPEVLFSGSCAGKCLLRHLCLNLVGLSKEMFVFHRHRSNTGQVSREPLQPCGRGPPTSCRLDRGLDHPRQEVLHRPQHQHHTLEPPSGEGGAPTRLGEGGVGRVWCLLCGSHQQESAVPSPLCPEVRHSITPSSSSILNVLKLTSQL